MHQTVIKQSIFNQIAGFLNRKSPLRSSHSVSNEEALLQVLRVLRFGIPWRDTDTTKYAWQTIYARFQKWQAKKGFVKLWKRVIRKYISCRISFDAKYFHELFIDSTKIKNVAGQDYVGKDSTDRGKLGTKVSAICDKDQTILGCVLTGANEPDISLTDPTLEDVSDTVKQKSKFLVGDKGYASYQLSDHLVSKYGRIRLITMVKKGNRPPNVTCTTKRAKHLLEKRHVIENAFASIKRFKRISRREDRKISSYRAFLCLATSIRTLSKME